tara:strand:- start:2544 stop:4739 length:2196 start_codon:yes stop_codon:yes gene_type:complete
MSSLNNYLGSEQCQSCHEKQFQAWQGSHHDMAMRHAKPDAVLADFNNAELEFNSKQNSFFKKNEQYWVNIEGPDGQFHDYQIKYTFGYQPLQQYMVEFDDGRVQLIPFAWDSRAKADGGQRWFHLYPQFTQKHQEFFWTNTGQNWNYMCAYCHSTNVKKNFDLKSNSYNTTFSEVNVGCESCHGPASNHINWLKKPDNTIKFSGFERDLTKSVTNWVSKPDRTTLTPEKIKHSQQTLTCAQCHSRHTQISDEDPVKSNEFGDRYMLSLLTPQLYYPDGQIYDENFVYGSFLQSEMHKNGVVCSNCHDPHSAKLTLPKEQVCLQCHQAETYQNSEHHHHQENSPGAQCINCHMPETIFMQIDGRRDHRWHIPRPAQSQQLGSPDVCLSCHQDKNSQWSEKITKQWHPQTEESNVKPFAPVFAAIEQGYSQASTALSQIAQSNDYAPIVRASALLRMNTLLDTNSLIAIARAVKSANTNIRLGAINGAENIAGAERWRIISPLLVDKALVVRTEATRVLMPLWQRLSLKQKQTLQPALDEYLEVQAFNEDRGFSHNNKAYVFMSQGKLDYAETAFKEGIRIEPFFANTYLNLSELYRRQQKETAAISELKQGLKAIPDNGQLHYNLALAYIRAKQTDKAIEFFKRATEASPENANFHYVYGLSLEKIQPEKAQLAIDKAFQISDSPQYLYTLCEMQIKQKSFKAKQCLQKLRQIAPENIIKQLEQQLNNKNKN